MQTDHYRLLVCGSRDYTDQKRLYGVLDKYLAALKQKGRPMMVISGGATGADHMAMKWAMSRKVDHVILYARWDEEGKAAGPIRNGRMADLEPHRVAAFSKDFSKSRGTNNMIKQARKRDITVKRYS